MSKALKDPAKVFKPAETTGSLIRSFRANFEISQDEMAFACGLSQANLSAIENDRREVGTRVALKLSAFMGLAPEIILYPNGYDKQPEFLEVIKRTKKLEEIAG
jgi:transcriptional regulator with XRE-family HTH domain